MDFDKQNPTPSQPPPAAPDKDVLMKQYQLIVDTDTKYLDLTLKFTMFGYAVTGAILSFYLSRPNEHIMKFALVFPACMNAMFSITCFLAAHWIDPLTDEVKRVVGELGLKAFPDPAFLKYVLIILAFLYVAITIGLVVISFVRP
jgi:hypothetical protein